MLMKRKNGARTLGGEQPVCGLEKLVMVEAERRDST
jgi:hypothetical protein